MIEILKEIIKNFKLFSYIISNKYAMNVRFVRSHKRSTAIAIFIVLMLLVHFLKPALVYHPDGSFRHFGVGYRNNTITPLWLVSILLAILSYLVVLMYTFV
jgi:hypothetical protein